MSALPPKADIEELPRGELVVSSMAESDAFWMRFTHEGHVDCE
jgi:hypothetical protein